MRPSRIFINTGAAAPPAGGLAWLQNANTLIEGKMLKNVAGQNITALLLDTDGAAVTTGTTTVYVTGDAGTQASMGTATHEGNGCWSIDVTQAESNYDDIGFTWVNTGAVTVHQHVFTDQSYDRLGAPAGASVSADIATVDSNVDAVLLDTGTDGVVIAAAQTVATVTDVTNQVTADVTAISGDTTAANNLEADYDGTGYTKANSTIGTCTTNTDMRGTDGANTTTPPTAAAIVNEWESQSQTDPTGFHVNVIEVGGTAQTANDNGADINAILADTNELQGDWADGGRLDLILDARMAEASINTTGGAVDTVTDVTNQVSADVTAISGDSTAADRLEALMDGTIIAQVNDASATTTAFAADGFTEATDDHFNGRLITFISGALTGQQTDITDYDAAGGAQGSQQFTVTALTEAPANNDFFVIH